MQSTNHKGQPASASQPKPLDASAATAFSWRNRRRMLWATVVFCMAVILYIIYKELASGTAETAISMAFVCLISIVGSYVFGAAWQDVSSIKSTKRSTSLQPPDNFQSDN